MLTSPVRTYCLDHRSETAHSCPKAGEWARRRAGISNTTSRSSTASGKANIFTHEKQCSSPQCKTLIDTPTTPGVQCEKCNRRYCLKHRMGEDHECDKLTPLGARPAGQKEKGLAALDRLRAWGASKKASAQKQGTGVMGGLRKAATSSSQQARNRTVAELNQLKRTAKGDERLPAEKRVHVYVEASADTTKAKHPSGRFYYSKDWTMGRVLDVAAKGLQVENVNNRSEGEGEKLRVFHVEQGRLLEFKEKVGDVLRDGNTIVLLRGVGPAVPDLIEA